MFSNSDYDNANSRRGGIDSILKREGGRPSFFRDSTSYGSFNSPTMDRRFTSSLFSDAMSSGSASKDLDAIVNPFKQKLLASVGDVQRKYSEGSGISDSSSIAKGMQNATNDLAQGSIDRYGDLLQYNNANRANARENLMRMRKKKKSPFKGIMGMLGSGLSTIARSIFGGL